MDINKLHKQSGLSKQKFVIKLAGELHISHRTVWNWLAGSNISAQNQKLIEGIYGEQSN